MVIRCPSCGTDNDSFGDTCIKCFAPLSPGEGRDGPLSLQTELPRIEVFRSSAVKDAMPLDLGSLAVLRSSPDVLNGLLVGFEKAGEIDAVRIRRLNNLPGELEHLVLVRQAKIGSSPYDVIQVRDSGIQERHTRLLVDKGQFWIECLADQATIGVNSATYRPGQRVGLVSGDVVQIGGTRMVFKADPAL